MLRYQLVRIMKKFFYPKATVDDLLTDKETIEIQKSQITDFPSSIPAAAHTHTKSEITDFPQTIPPSSHTHTKSEITDFPSTMTPTSHSHGNLNNNGLLNSDVTGENVKKVVVTDSTQNLKTISKIPFSNLEISKSNITGLGIPETDTNTTYSAGTGLNLNGTTFNVHNVPSTQLIHTVTNNCDFSNITGGTPLSVGSEVAQSGINELLDARLGELFSSTGEVSTRTLRNTDMQAGRFNSESSITFYRIGKLCIANYHLKGNSSFSKGSTVNICNFPAGFIPNESSYSSTWINATSGGQVNADLVNGTYQMKIYIATANTSNNIVGQLIYFTD